MQLVTLWSLFCWKLQLLIDSDGYMKGDWVPITYAFTESLSTTDLPWRPGLLNNSAPRTKDERWGFVRRPYSLAWKPTSAYMIAFSTFVLLAVFSVAALAKGWRDRRGVTCTRVETVQGKRFWPKSVVSSRSPFKFKIQNLVLGYRRELITV